MEQSIYPIKIADNYICYSIPDEKQFSNIEYKVLLNQSGCRLLRCFKVRNNGTMLILYNVQQLQAVKGILTSLTIERFYNFLGEVISNYRFVKNNGFLRVEHIEMDLDRMYLSLEPMQLSMIYLPIEYENDSKHELVDGSLRNFIKETIKSYSHKKDDGLSELITHIDSELMKLEEIEDNLYKGIYAIISIKGREREEEESKQSHCENTKFILKGANSDLTLYITKTEFVIGKKASVVDGVISKHATVSRIHCKIINIEDKIYVVDLGSVNGTLVNGVSCCPNIPVEIHKGDQITIADLKFYFQVEK